MSQIIPAILETSEQALSNRLFEITHFSGLERIQIDIVDGQFAPMRTVMPEDMPPLSPVFAWEAHVMAKMPIDFLEYKTLGFRSVIVHLESFADINHATAALSELASLGLEPGLALSPVTNLNDALVLLPYIHSLTLLGVEPGRQGQGQVAHFIDRVRQAREKYPHVILEIDGGVNLENVSQFARAGVDRIVVGSAIFHTDNPAQHFYDLSLRANSL